MHDVRSAPARPPLGELAHLFSYVRPYRRRFVLALVASIVSMAFGSMFPYLVGTLLDASIPSVKVFEAAPWQRDLDIVALILFGTLLVQAALMFTSSLAFHVSARSSICARSFMRVCSRSRSHFSGSIVWVN